jgi:hypothetical protein
MGKSLDEFVEKYSAVKFLKNNLKSNIDVYCSGWDEEEKEQFLRMQMIMVRQCLQDFGAE